MTDYVPTLQCTRHEVSEIADKNAAGWIESATRPRFERLCDYLMLQMVLDNLPFPDDCRALSSLYISLDCYEDTLVGWSLGVHPGHEQKSNRRLNDKMLRREKLQVENLLSAALRDTFAPKNMCYHMGYRTTPRGPLTGHEIIELTSAATYFESWVA